MLKFDILHQPEYSRGELLFRTFLGWLYLAIPHGLVLMFFGIIYFFMSIAGFFIILFTGVTPEWYYNWSVKLNRWVLRVSARMYNLADGYPAFGMEATDDKTTYELASWQISQGQCCSGSSWAGFMRAYPICLLYGSG